MAHVTANLHLRDDSPEPKATMLDCGSAAVDFGDFMNGITLLGDPIVLLLQLNAASTLLAANITKAA